MCYFCKNNKESLVLYVANFNAHLQPTNPATIGTKCTSSTLLSLGRSSARRSSLGDLGSAGLLLLSNALVHKGSVGGGLSLGVLEGLLGLNLALSLAADSDGGDQSLNLGALGDGLALLLNGTGNDVLSNIISLGKVEQIANLVGSLGAESLGDRHIGEALDLVVTLLDDDKVQHSEVRTNNATMNGFLLRSPTLRAL